MRDPLPIPGSTRAKLITAGLDHFGRLGYATAEVDQIASDAGVTVGSLYHHFQSKLAFYGLLRDEMTQRLLDRMEAAADAVPARRALSTALLAAYDGGMRLRVGRLLTEPDPRNAPDGVADTLARLAESNGHPSAHIIGPVLAAALRAALANSGDNVSSQTAARTALAFILRIGAED